MFGIDPLRPAQHGRIPLHPAHWQQGARPRHYNVLQSLVSNFLYPSNSCWLPFTSSLSQHGRLLYLDSGSSHSLFRTDCEYRVTQEEDWHYAGCAAVV